MIRLLARVAASYARLCWHRLQIWYLPRATRIELWLAARLGLGAAYHFWRAGRMMGVPRLPGESTRAYGRRLMRHAVPQLRGDL